MQGRGGRDPGVGEGGSLPPDGRYLQAGCFLCSSGDPLPTGNSTASGSLCHARAARPRPTRYTEHELRNSQDPARCVMQDGREARAVIASRAVPCRSSGEERDASATSSNRGRLSSGLPLYGVITPTLSCFPPYCFTLSLSSFLPALRSQGVREARVTPGRRRWGNRSTGSRPTAPNHPHKSGQPQPLHTQPDHWGPTKQVFEARDRAKGGNQRPTEGEN